MARPIRWSRELHSIRELAAISKTETWSRQDIERLFSIGRASAQNLMKAIGEVQTVGAAHFVDRASLLAFLNEMISSESLEDGLKRRLESAEPVLRPHLLARALPQDLRQIAVRDLPASIRISPGELRITGENAEQIVEGLLLLAQAMQNDLDRFRALLDPPLPAAPQDEDLKALLQDLREISAARAI
jgi:hypothetical protein